MIDRIGKHFLDWQLNKSLNSNKVPRSNVSFGRSKDIGVLFSSERKAKTDLIEKFAEELRKEEKKVHLLAFVNKGADIPSGGLDFFTEKDISILGQINNQKAIDFANRPFDYLFCFDQSPSILVRQILAMSKAKFRIGNFQSEELNNFFELMVKMPEKSGDHGMIREMEHFTKYLIKE